MTPSDSLGPKKGVMRRVFAAAIVYVDKRLPQDSSKFKKNYGTTRLLFDAVDWHLKAVGPLY